MLGAHGRGITAAICALPARGLARAGVTPNQVTVAGTVLTVVASVGLLATGHTRCGPWVLGAIVLADSLDGSLARLTGASSRFGAFLDSCLDRVGDGAIFASLTAWAALGMPSSAARTLAVIAGVASIVGAAAVPYTRARGEAYGVVAAVGIAERSDRLLVSLVACFVTGLTGSDWFLAAGLTWVALACSVTVIQRLIYVSKRLEQE